MGLEHGVFYRGNGLCKGQGVREIGQGSWRMVSSSICLEHGVPDAGERTVAVVKDVARGLVETRL